MLRVDTHVHSNFSRDAKASPEGIVRRCQRVGLNVIAVTDHNTIRGGLEVKRIAPFPVIVGEEVMTTQGDLIGLFLQEEVPQGLSAIEAAQCIKEQGGLVVLPHPFDTLRHGIARHGVEAVDALLPLTDAAESYNASCMRSGYNERADEYIKAHSIPDLSASDAHFIGELGYTYTLMPEFDLTPQGFMAALAQARHVNKKILLRDRAYRTVLRIRRVLTGSI